MTLLQEAARAGDARHWKCYQQPVKQPMDERVKCIWVNLSHLQSICSQERTGSTGATCWLSHTLLKSQQKHGKNHLHMKHLGSIGLAVHTLSWFPPNKSRFFAAFHCVLNIWLAVLREIHGSHMKSWPTFLLMTSYKQLLQKRISAISHPTTDPRSHQSSADLDLPSHANLKMWSLQNPCLGTPANSKLPQSLLSHAGAWGYFAMFSLLGQTASPHIS